jgi:hypothetical protein
MLISTALLLDSIIRNSVCTPAKLPCRRVEVGYEKLLLLLCWFSSNITFISKRSKIAPSYIIIETVEVAFFVTGLETLQVLGVKMSTGISTEPYFKYLIIKLSILRKASEKSK